MIGISTYAYLWRMSTRMPHPISLFSFLERVSERGVGLVQICDYSALDRMEAGDVAQLKSRARSHGLDVELGTRGVEAIHLRRYLELAVALDCTLVRTMIAPHDGVIDLEWAAAQLRMIMPAYEQAGVTLAIETYEQVRSRSLVETVEAVGSPALGVCLDPGNSIAALELPTDVVTTVAPHVRNIHIKDFRFVRDDSTVGFRLTGAPFGEGLLDYAQLVEVVRPRERRINLILEQWLPWQGDPVATAELEEAWLDASLFTLRSLEPRSAL